MVSVQTWIAIVFIIVMSLLLYRYRKKVRVQHILGPFLYFVMIRTTWGLSAMDWLGTKLRRPLKWFGYVSVVVGFAGMLLITYQLIKSTVELFISPGMAPGIQPVLPFEAKGVFFVPFAYWIISIFIIAVIHEFAHGVLARAHKIRVKSSGFAFLGILVPIIPAAFVEPDEKHIVKRKAWHQMSVFAAGPVANIFMAIAMVFAFGIDASPFIPYSVTQNTAIVDITELGTSLITFQSLSINRIEPGSPAEAAGLLPGEEIVDINGVSVSDREATLETISSLEPGSTITLGLSDRFVNLKLAEHPENPEIGYIGIGFKPETQYDPSAVAKYGNFGIAALFFFISIIIWIFILSLGIGLFNLVPLGPIDGGRMLKLALEKFTGSIPVGTRIWKGISIAILGMIIVNLIAGFIG